MGAVPTRRYGRSAIAHHLTIKVKKCGWKAYNAIDQAEVTAQNILGAKTPYQPEPWFWSDQYNVKLQIAGLNTGYSDVVERAVQTADSCSFWYYKDDTLLAVDAMNAPKAYMVDKRLLGLGKSPPKAAISDPQTDLKSLLKS